MNYNQQTLLRNFNKVADTYLKHAYVQKYVADSLIQQFLCNIDKTTLVDKLILDLGSGPGTFLHNSRTSSCAQSQDPPIITTSNLTNIINYDMCINMLKTGNNINQNTLLSVLGDACSLPFKPHSFDYVMSNLLLQWLPHKLDIILTEIKRILKPNGLFIFSVLTTPSFHQLNDIWGSFDNYLHTIKCFDSGYYTNKCNDFNLSIKNIEYGCYNMEFNSYIELIKHFKMTGTNLPIKNTNKIMNKQQLNIIDEAYKNKYMNRNKKIDLSYYYATIVVTV